MPEDEDNYFRRVLLSAIIIFSITFILLLIAFAVDILLLVFAGVLLALFLRGISVPAARLLHLNQTLALVLTLLVLVFLMVLSVQLVAPHIADQIGKMKQQIPNAVEQLRAYSRSNAWVQDLLQRIPEPAVFFKSRIGMLKGITDFFSTTFSALINSLIIFVLGLYLSFEPNTYMAGFLKLVAPANREHAKEIMDALASILRRWLLGRMLSMTVVGALTWVGLIALGIPLALTLSLLAALLTFIPNIGPFLSVVPAALLALVKGPYFALYVLLLYTAIQTVESYLITPIIQRYTVSLPPALTIVAQIILGLLLGFLGLVLATPLTAAILVLIKMLYIEDVLKDRVELPGKT